MSVTIDGLPELLARFAAAQADLLVSAGPALHDAVDELITVPSKDDAPKEAGTMADSGRTEGPAIEGTTVTVVSTFGRGDDGDETHAPSNQYVVKQHEDLSLSHPQGGSAKWLERKAMENAPQLLGAVAEKMRGR